MVTVEEEDRRAGERSINRLFRARRTGIVTVWGETTERRGERERIGITNRLLRAG